MVQGSTFNSDSGGATTFSADCADGFTGSATATTCDAAGGEYILDGCVKDCVEPADETGYTNITDPTSMVQGSTFNSDSGGATTFSADCADGFTGSATATTCDTPGGEYILDGCVQDRISPTSTTGYTDITDPTSMAYNGWSDCGFSSICAVGYTGTPTVTVCTAAGGEYVLGGCVEEEESSSDADVGIIVGAVVGGVVGVGLLVVAVYYLQASAASGAQSTGTTGVQIAPMGESTKSVPPV